MNSWKYTGSIKGRERDCKLHPRLTRFCQEKQPRGWVTHYKHQFLQLNDLNVHSSSLPLTLSVSSPESLLLQRAHTKTRSTVSDLLFMVCSLLFLMIQSRISHLEASLSVSGLDLSIPIVNKENAPRQVHSQSRRQFLNWHILFLGNSGLCQVEKI